jgi:hypothetical protein
LPPARKKSGIPGQAREDEGGNGSNRSDRFTSQHHPKRQHRTGEPLTSAFRIKRAVVLWRELGGFLPVASESRGAFDIVSLLRDLTL